MNTESNARVIEMADQVDRLVCGELDEADRQRLLAWLEADPVRWRLCGVAFLEAQAWSRAIDRWPNGNGPLGAVTSAIERAACGQSRMRHPACFRLATLAAAVVVAFGLGLAVRDFSAPAQRAGETEVVSGAAAKPPRPDLPEEGEPNLPPNHQSVLASLNVETGDGFGRSTPIQIPVVPAAFDENRVLGHAEIPDYVRQQWETRGYKVSLERRFLFAKLADGQQVVVPVEQLHVNPLPIHIN